MAGTRGTEPLTGHDVQADRPKVNERTAVCVEFKLAQHPACIRQSGSAEMFDIALMPVTREWLPYANTTERELLRVAVTGRGSFVKGMRVDLEASRPIANITLTDTAPQAVAVHLAADDDLDRRPTRDPPA